MQTDTIRELFLLFLSVRGTSDTNCVTDVEFWLEVQRYKVLHVHVFICMYVYSNVHSCLDYVGKLAQCLCASNATTLKLILPQRMCHSHTNHHILSEKLTAMKECYLNSSVPPKLHINIPQRMADAIVQKEEGPYIFREAQATVFRHLYGYWHDYQLLSRDLNPSEIAAEIEKMKTQMKHFRKVLTLQCYTLTC